MSNMPVGLKSPTNILPIAGIRLAAECAGIKSVTNPDVVLIELNQDCRVAVSLTKNLFCAAPVKLVKQHLVKEQPRYLLINSGNANAGTGDQGMADARASCRLLAELTELPLESVLPFSTGVIGQALPVNKIKSVLPDLLKKLHASAWLNAAEGIMTTDTLPKVVSGSVETQDGEISITGIAKGAGMICPDMATMLSFIATDVDISQDELNDLHLRLVGKSFNKISIDGDTSTNDSCVLMATGRGAKLSKDSVAWKAFEQKALEVYQQLAQAIVRDGEGVTKFVTVNVVGGATQTDCEKVARTVAHSPLVKTALYASDANWGRILAAVGRAGVELDINKVDLIVNDVTILKNGVLADDYTEQAGTEAVASEEIEILVSLGSGSAEYSLWTSDLSHEYVSINADYRT